MHNFYILLVSFYIFLYICICTVWSTGTVFTREKTYRHFGWMQRVLYLISETFVLSSFRLFWKNWKNNTHLTGKKKHHSFLWSVLSFHNFIISVYCDIFLTSSRKLEVGKDYSMIMSKIFKRGALFTDSCLLQHLERPLLSPSFSLLLRLFLQALQPTKYHHIE